MLKNKKKTDRFLSAILAVLMFATAVMPAYAAEDVGYEESAVNGADADAVFLDGDAFNQTILALAGSGESNAPDTAIGAVRWAGSVPEDADTALVSAKESESPVTAWYEAPAEEGTAGTVWFYTEGRPALPEDASGMFAGMAALTDISMLEDVDFSGARDLSGMFEGDAFLADAAPVKDACLDSAGTIAAMFRDCALLSDVSVLGRHEADGYTAWNVPESADVTDAFAGTGVTVFPDWYAVPEKEAEAVQDTEDVQDEAQAEETEDVQDEAQAEETEDVQDEETPVVDAEIVMDNEADVMTEENAKAAISTIMEGVRLMTPAPGSATQTVEVSTTGAAASYGAGSTRYYNFNGVANHGVCVVPGRPGIASSATLKQVEVTASSYYGKKLRNLMYVMPDAPGFANLQNVLPGTAVTGTFTQDRKNKVANYIAAVKNFMTNSQNLRTAYTHLLMAYGYEIYRTNALGHTLGPNDHWYSIGANQRLNPGNDYYENVAKWMDGLWAYAETMSNAPSNFHLYLVYSGDATGQDYMYWTQDANTNGKLRVQKRVQGSDPFSEDSNSGIGGAKFGVYRNKTLAESAAFDNNYFVGHESYAPIAILTINSNGYSNAVDLKAGTYYVKEIAPPNSGYFEMNPYVATATVTAGQTLTVQYQNGGIPEISNTSSVRLRKVDEKGNALKGVTFEIKRKGAAWRKTLTTGDDGYTPSLELGKANTEGKIPRGIYTYQEISTQQGYVLDSTKKTFIVDYTGNVYEGYDDAGDNIFYAPGEYIFAPASFTQAGLRNFATKDTIWHIPSSPNGVVNDYFKWNISYGSESVEFGNKTCYAATITSKGPDTPGKVLARNGSQIVLENPDGSDDQKWIIQFNQYTAQTLLYSWDGKKCISKNNKDIILTQPDGSLATMWTLIPCKYSTDIAGKTYTIVSLNGGAKDMVVNASGDIASGHLQTYHYDATGANQFRFEKVGDQQYVITKTFHGRKHYVYYDKTSTQLKWTADRSNALKVTYQLSSSFQYRFKALYKENENDNKTYYLQMFPGQATAMTLIASNKINDSNLATTQFALDQVYPELIVTVANTKNKMRIYKTDNEDAPLKDATFHIWDENGTVDTTLTTGEDGYTAYLEGLATGTWHYQETAAPTGYVMDTTVYTFYVLSDGKITKTQNGKDGVAEFAAGPIVNSTNKMHIKKEDDQGTALPGATFHLWNEAGSVDKSLTTGADGWTPYVYGLTTGTWHYQETSAPTGYVMDTTVYTFYVLSDGKITKTQNGTDGTTDFEAGPVTNTRYGSAYVLKEAAASSKALVEGNSLYSLAGATYVIYSDKARTQTVGDPLITDSTGKTQTVQLAPGTYYVKETAAPQGYCLDPKMDGITSAESVNDNLKPDYWTFTVTSGDTTVITSEEPAENDPIKLEIKKADAEGGTSYSLAGAQFTIDFYGAWFEDANYTNKTVPGGVTPLKSWTIETKEETVAGVKAYRAELDDEYLVGENVALYKDNGQTVLPYGTIVIRETKAPANYELSNQVEMYKIDSHFEETHSEGVLKITVDEQVKRYPLTFHKQDSDGTALAGIPFILTNTTTGESHVIVTDANGNFNSETVAHKTNTNKNDEYVNAGAVTNEAALSSGFGVWFGPAGSADNTKKALTPGSYTLTELRVRANRHCSLITQSFTVPSNAADGAVALGTITDQIIQHGIATKAASVKTGTNIAFAESNASFTDIVTLSGYNNGKETTITTRAYNVTDGSYIKLNGTKDSITKTVTATHVDEDVTVTFAIDASALAGKKIAIETKVTNEEIEMGDEIKHNENHTDENEMIYFPKVTTVAMIGNAKAVQAGGTKTVTDRVEVTGLPTGTDIIAAAELYELGATAANDAKVSGAAGESTATAADDGSASLTTGLSLNTDASAGKSYYVTEKVYITVGSTRHLVASEIDRTNTDQTVSFIGIGTTLTDSETKAHVAYPDTSVTLNDLVSYSGLTTGKTYPVITVLMDANGHAYKKDGSVSESLAADLMVCNDPTATTTAAKRTAITAALEAAQVIYAVTDKQATAKDGTLTVDVTFNGVTFAGKKTVAAEAIYDENMNVFATHIVPSDEGQTVRFPSIGTTAVCTETGAKMIPRIEDVSVTDTVAYNMIPAGTVVKTTASVYVKGATAGADTLLATKTETRTIGEETGSYDVTVDIDSTGLTGKTLYMTEKVYVTVDNEEVLIAEHVDRDDVNQTVYVPQITTLAVNTATNDKALNTVGTASITDIITYTNLVPERQYGIETTVYAKGAGTNGSDVLIESMADKTSFMPNTASGTVDVTVTFDASPYKGYDIYVNETITGAVAPEGPTGAVVVEKIAEETGKDVPAQTVHAVELGTTLTETDTEKKSVKPATSVSLTDTVRYDGLIAGTTYNAIAIYMNEDGNAWKKDGTASTLTAADLNVCTDKARLTAENILYAEQSFTAGSSGTFTTTLTFNASLFAGQTIVASETVYDANGSILAMHSDASDAGQTITVNNSAKAWIHKVSGMTRRGMNGVEFKFWQGDDETHAVTLTTSAENAPSGEYATAGQDPNGWVYFGELTAGTTYHFKETKTRQGMNLDSRVHTITVLSDGTVQIDGEPTGQTVLKLEVTNNKAITLMTGGEGRTMIYIVGGAMLVALLALLYMRKKKKNG